MPEGLLDLLTGAERNHLLALLTAGPTAIWKVVQGSSNREAPVSGAR